MEKELTFAEMRDIDQTDNNILFEGGFSFIFTELLALRDTEEFLVTEKEIKGNYNGEGNPPVMLTGGFEETEIERLHNHWEGRCDCCGNALYKTPWDDNISLCDACRTHMEDHIFYFDCLFPSLAEEKRFRNVEQQSFVVDFIDWMNDEWSIANLINF